VVEERDATELADLAKATGYLDVGSGRRRVAGYVDLPITGVMGTSALCGDPAYRPSAPRWECSA
jgi:hypothetical protein